MSLYDPASGATLAGQVTHPKPDITFVTDGGPENNLTTGSGQTIEHKIALVDVHYSNSMIEAHNKIVKYNYLFRMDIPDGKHLRKIFSWIVVTQPAWVTSTMITCRSILS